MTFIQRLFARPSGADDDPRIVAVFVLGGFVVAVVGFVLGVDPVTVTGIGAMGIGAAIWQVYEFAGWRARRRVRGKRKR